MPKLFAVAEKTFKPKLRAAREALERRFHGGVNTMCIVILDVLVFVCIENPSDAVRHHPDYHARRSFYPQLSTTANSPRAYARIQWFKHKSSQMRVLVESERVKPYLAPYRVTLYADDLTGLLPAQVLGLLEVMPAARLILLELAFDFSLLSHVDRTFVRRHGRFGKSQRDRTKNDS
jgi:hypothetical protein